MKPYDEIHIKHLKGHLNQLKTLYRDFAYACCLLALKVGERERLFSFMHPALREPFKALKQNFNQSLFNTLAQGVREAWALANEKHDALAQQYRPQKRYPHNRPALTHFLAQKRGKLTLSERVWHLTEQNITELELALAVVLQQGQSAQQLSRAVRKYLNHPNALYRRVRDKHGHLVLSKAAKAFHPGQGVYRSSYKNALRLASNEINKAYRDSEQLRIAQNPDVVGVEIYLSPQHSVYDMCDALKGKYPKDFQWNQWHIGCKCYRRVIMKTEQEFIAELKQNKTLPPETSQNYVGDLPENAKQWLKENAPRLQRAKYLPKWLEENGVLDRGEVRERLKKILTPNGKQLYVVFEPFSPIVREEFSKLKSKTEKRRLFNELLNDEGFSLVSHNNQKHTRTVIHQQSKERKSKHWNQTKQMAKELNQYEKDVIFLAEYENLSSADALLLFKGKYTLADFKYFTTKKSNTIFVELERTFQQTPTIVMKMEKGGLDIFSKAIEEMKRKNKKIGNIILLNKYGQVRELERREFYSKKYINELRGFL